MQQTESNWHQLDAQAVIQNTGSSENGLDDAKAARLLEETGPNMLTRTEKISPLKVFLGQFTGKLVIVLIIAGILSFIISDYLEGIVILAIVIINAALGFQQEYKAEKSMEALRKMTALSAKVVRSGKTRLIDATQIVPGDIVILEAGDKVPADIRLIEAFNLKIDEAILTGESNPSSKDQKTIAGEKAVADRKNMCFANTIVTYGRAKGIVVATAMKTEFGKIAGLIAQAPQEDTPLKKKLEVLGNTLIKITTVIIAVLFIVGVIYGNEIHEMFKVAVSLGVAAIPEGLPAVITITLGAGALQMAKRNALVRKMPAVEALGSVTVICSDKTGTLTRNEMVVQKIFADGKLIEVTGTGYEPAGEFFLEGKKIDIDIRQIYTETPPYLSTVVAAQRLMTIGTECNDAQLDTQNGQYSVIGDPTEGSLTVLALKANITKNIRRVDEIPFESERKMMTTIHELEGKRFAYSKGALEKILDISESVFENNKIQKLSEQKKKGLMQQGEILAKQAYRVLGFSFKEFNGKEKAEEKMVFAGFVAMSDPVRENVRDAIQTTKNAGIQVKMITGDNPLTALAIGEKIGLGGPAVNGAELDHMTEQEFIQTVQNTSIFARVSPEHKYRIVKTLKELGEIVAVTGDGVNDAPALKKADIGIAMGIKGTDVSKEASDLILKDDQFSTIVEAIKEGRRIYSNIKSFVKYLLAANIGEVIIITLAMILNFSLPLVPMQLLWLNIVTDSLPALALGSDKGEKDAMQRKPRNPKEKILDNTFSFIIIAGIISTLVTFIAFFYGLGFDLQNGAGIDFLKTEEGYDFASKARTMAFTTLVVFELMFVFSCRGENKSVFEHNPLSNPFLVKMVALSFLIQVAAVYWPVIAGFLLPGTDTSTINAFDTVALSLADWAVVLGLSAVSISVPYIARAVHKKFTKQAFF